MPKILFRNFKCKLKERRLNLKGDQMIETRIEGKRGCGYRKKGALYLVSTGPFYSCGRLPVKLDVCPCCGSGFKPARGFTWIDGDKIAKMAKKKTCGLKGKNIVCMTCPLSDDSKVEFGKAGLIWIGTKFYSHKSIFALEAAIMGISRRINFVPHGFKIGETWIFLAHRKGYEIMEFGKDPEFYPGIFQVFQPTAIEIICDGTETDEEIEKFRKRGLTPVIVKKKENKELFT